MISEDVQEAIEKGIKGFADGGGFEFFSECLGVDEDDMRPILEQAFQLAYGLKQVKEKTPHEPFMAIALVVFSNIFTSALTAPEAMVAAHVLTNQLKLAVVDKLHEDGIVTDETTPDEAIDIVKTLFATMDAKNDENLH